MRGLALLFALVVALILATGHEHEDPNPGLLSFMKGFRVDLTDDERNSQDSKDTHPESRVYQVLDTFEAIENAVEQDENTKNEERLAAVRNILGGFKPWTVQIKDDRTYTDTEKTQHHRKDDITQKILDYVDPQSISNYLRQLTLVPHVAGTAQDLEQAEFISNEFKSFGLDEVSMIPYEVLLSYPLDKKHPNKVHIIDSEGNEVYSTCGVQPPRNPDTPEEWSDLIMPNFNGYSAPGTVEGDLVYAYFGRDEDFRLLKTKGIDVKGKVVIARYGAVFRANIAKFAQDNGAKGLILYSDPKDFAQEGTDDSEVYPAKIWMPELAVQEGTTKWTDGDALTPLYPSIESAYRIDVKDAPIPKIPIQPIGYAEAEVFLSQMKGDTAPADWQGSLNATYRLGPGLANDRKVKMVVMTDNYLKTTYNIIGTIQGEIEPDRYVLLGNHRDTWSMNGAIDPLSGTAGLLEMARVLTKISKETGWKPRRTIVFCSWGAEEYGLIGSTEWVEEHMNILDSRAVAYINIDLMVQGNSSFRALGVPLLYDVLFDSARKIPNPNPDEVAAGRPTLFDTWVKTFPDGNTGEPSVWSIGSGSDYSPFMHYIGVPSADLRYTYVEDIPSYPLYHSLHETFYLMADLYDRGFYYSASLTGLWAEIARALADSQVLPFSVDKYGKHLVKQVAAFEEKYGSVISQQKISLESFVSAAAKFSSATSMFQNTTLAKVDLKNPYDVRRVNDLMTFIERSFIEPRGLPGRPEFRHVLFAPSSKDIYSASSFSGLTDILWEIQTTTSDTTELWEEFKRHLAAITYLIHCAANSLTDNIHTRTV